MENRNKGRREQASCLRQEMKQVVAEMGRMVEEIMGRGLQVKGTLYKRKRRCGDHRCHCRGGELHESEAFSYSDGGRTRHISLGKVRYLQLKEYANNYRCFRHTRARLCKNWGVLVKLVDEMELLHQVSIEEIFDQSLPSQVVRRNG